MLDRTVKDLVLAGRGRMRVAVALAELGITPRYAGWSLAGAAQAVGVRPEVAERRLLAALEAA